MFTAPSKSAMYAINKRHLCVIRNQEGLCVIRLKSIFLCIFFYHSYFHLWYPYPEPMVIQWQSSDNPMCLELRPQCTLECHWRKNVLPVGFQWSSSGLPVVFECVPIMQINTGSPLVHHWVLASSSVVPVASQCNCGSSGFPVCFSYAN